MFGICQRASIVQCVGRQSAYRLYFCWLIYTLAYIVDQGFKRKGYNKNERLKFVRSVLLSILDLVTVINIDNEYLRKGVMDESFTDLEDSFQYQVSILGKCDAIITLNVKDFKGISSYDNIVFTPNQFVNQTTCY